MIRKRLFITALIAIAILTGYFFYKDSSSSESPYTQQEMVEAITHFNSNEEYDKALLLAKEYVQLYPNDLNGWNHRGYAYLKLGNCDEALSDFYHASVNGNKFADTLISSVSNSDECK